jgi:hypothetical protein
MVRDEPWTRTPWVHVAGTHQDLARSQRLQSTSRATARVFSLGLNAVQLADLLCGGPCETEGVGHLSLVIECQENSPRLGAYVCCVPLLCCCLHVDMHSIPSFCQGGI